MDNSLLVNLDHHRSRERIRGLGEVFTPEHYVQHMLNLFDQKIWADENVIFFEPTAGHGNIILAILARRTEALTSKFKRSRENAPLLSGIATALNTLWAIDICPLNIDYSRKRIFDFTIQYFLANGVSLRSKNTKDFLAHVLCTLLWQVQENEAISALSDSATATAKASKIKLSRDWINKNKHKPISFENDWCSHFELCAKSKTVPIVFERARRFLDAVLAEGNSRGFTEFNFARTTLEKILGVL